MTISQRPSNPYIVDGLRTLIGLTERAGYDRSAGAKLPRAEEMRAYRFAVQDIILAAWAMRHAKELDAVEVDAFVAAEVVDAETGIGGFYDELAGAHAALLAILSETYKVGAQMQVHFTKNVEKGRVPLDVVRLANRHQLGMRDPETGWIRAEEGRRLYVALTGFRPKLRQRLEELARAGLVSMERAAYIVHHGVWSLPEVEGIILGSPYPDMVLAGEVHPEQRHLYDHVQTHARVALLGAYLDRALVTRIHDQVAPETGRTIGKDAEDDEREIDIRFDPRFMAREYVLMPNREGSASFVDDSAPLPNWECEPVTIEPFERLVALVRPRSASDMLHSLGADLQRAAIRKKQKPIANRVVVLVPFDFHDMSPAQRQHFRDEACRLQVPLLVCPETIRALDTMARKKMADSRIRQD
ncbi:MAG: hypothetical protein ABIZ80_12665 [Bryobacteraceae bacterium]